MFSNDNNVETIAQFVEVVKHYAGLQTEYIKLDMAPAFCIVGGVYLLVIILFLCYRKKFIERPLVRLLANIFLSK